MKHCSFLIYLLFCISASAQKNYEPEKITWQGSSYPYRYHHMEQYFRYYPEKRPVPNSDTTIINRNYIAAFEVKDKKFYLDDIYIQGANKNVKDLSVLHELNTKNEPMFLSWISGLFDIGVGTGKIIKNDTMNPVYEQYIVFEVDKGHIGRVENFNYNQLKLFKDYQYRRFKETPDYRRLFRRLLYNGMTEPEVSAHIYEFILFYSKTNFLK